MYVQGYYWIDGKSKKLLKTKLMKLSMKHIWNTMQLLQRIRPLCIDVV